MPSNLTSQYIKFTYRQLLHVSDGVTASLKTVYSGLGVATALKVSVGSVAVDNLKFDGNVISSTDTDGDIILTPNGTGKVNIGAINITGGVITGITDLAIADGGTGASTAAGARDNLGLEIGADIMPFYVSQTYGRSLWNAASAAAARALLGINESGSTALLVANNLSDLADVPTAQINLQLEPGVDVQVWNANLDDWATKLSSDYATTSYVTSAISTAGGAYQPLDSDLTSIAALTTTSFGRGLLTESSASTARTTLGITATGSDTTYAYRANNLSDLASASTARTNLGLGTAAVKNTGTSGNNVALLDGANTWSAAQNETFASTGFTKTLTNTDAGSLGVGIKMVHDSASPAANDVPGYINIYGKDSAGNEELYGYFQTCIVSPTNGAETSFSQMGSKANSIRIGSGLYFSQGSATSDMGLSTVNAAGYYINGTSLFATANTWSGANKFTSDVGPQFNSPFLGFWNAAGTRKAYIQAVAAGTLTIQPESDTVGVRINVNGGAATVEGDTIATLTASQSLSNKTLSSPTISGTVAGAYTRSNTTTYSQGYGVNFANSGATHGLFDYNNTTLIMTHNTADWKTSVRLFSTSMHLYANNGLASWDGTSFAIGDGSAIAAGKINGSGSGTNGGAFLGIYNNSTTIAAIGNYSSIIGGAYDGSMLFYIAATSIQFRVGGSVQWLNVNSSGIATFGSSVTVSNELTMSSATNGVVWYNGSGSYRWIGGVRSDITGNVNDWVLYNSSFGTALQAKHSTGELIGNTGGPTSGNSLGFRGLNNVADKGSSYTFVLTDAGRAVNINDSGSNTFTVPPNSSVAYPAGTVLCGTNHGSGTLTVARGSGVTFRNQAGTDANLTVPQWSRYYLERSYAAADTWYVRVG